MRRIPLLPLRPLCVQILVLVVCIAPVGTSLTLAQEVEAGKLAISARDYERAVDILQQGLDRARENGDADLQATIVFNLGLAHQQWAESALRQGNDTLGRDQLTAAEEHYRNVLAMNPASGGVYNNLARLYEQLGRNEAATDAYRRAIALDDERKPLFLLNFADFLQRQRQHRAAVDYYLQVLEAQPDNDYAHENLVDTYLAVDAADRTRLIDYLWNTLNDGRELRACGTSLHVLNTAEWEGSGERILSQKIELLTLAVVGLSTLDYAPDSLQETEWALALQSLAEGDPDVGRGALEVLQLYYPTKLSNVSFEWWAFNAENRFGEPPPGRVSPLDAIRMLIRSRGAWHQQHQDEDTAIAYYFTSLRIPAERTDPSAVLELAKIYFIAGTPERVDALLERYSPDLFQGKSASYRTSDWKKTYEYHRSLGIMYSFIGRWGNSSTPTSAIFQLERAREHARRYNSELMGDQPAQRIHVEPQMIDYLARAYEAISAPQSAYRVRLEAAEEYMREGDRESSEYVLNPLETRTLPEDLKVRYETLQVRIQTPQTRLQNEN